MSDSGHPGRRPGADPGSGSTLRISLLCLAVVLLVVVVTNAVTSGDWARLLVKLVALGCLVVAGRLGFRAATATPYDDGAGAATDQQVLRRRLLLLGVVGVLVATGLFLLQVG